MRFGMSRKDSCAKWGTVSVWRGAVGQKIRPTAAEQEFVYVFVVLAFNLV
jgi:hypothetical protein